MTSFTIASNDGPAACLALHLAETHSEHMAAWRINGYPARVLIWTAEEWSRLAHPPQDAQYVGHGLWCALRMD